MILERHCEEPKATCPPHFLAGEQSLIRDCFPACRTGRASLAMTITVFVFFAIFVPFAFAELPPSKDAIAPQGLSRSYGIKSINGIAFSRLTNGYWQIWSVDPNGDNLLQRTFSPKDKRNPVWRPRVAPPQPSPLRKRGKGVRTSSPILSQWGRIGGGGDQILYHTNDNQLFLFDLAAQEEIELLPELGRIGDACFTPDGKKLIFTRFDENTKDVSNLWIYDFGSREKTVLTSDPGLQYSPHVSQDGTQLVYVSGKGWGTHEIWLLVLETKEKTRLTENKVYDLSPEFSPDGSRIAYASNLMGNYDIWLMDSNGKNQRKITKPLGMESSPTWSPDGKQLAIASQRGGNLQIWVIDPEGKEWKQLTFGEEESREPSWRKS